MSVKQPKQHLFFQLYMNKDRAVTEKVVRELQSTGFSAIMLTVDAAMPGKRELDQRTTGDWEGPAANGKASSESKGIAHVRGSFRDRDKVLTRLNDKSIGGYQDPDVYCKSYDVFQEQRYMEKYCSGDDIPWIRSLTKLPLVIKGIQCLEVSERH